MCVNAKQRRAAMTRRDVLRQRQKEQEIKETAGESSCCDAAVMWGLYMGDGGVQCIC